MQTIVPYPIPHTLFFYVLFVFAASSSVCSVPPHIQNVCVVIIGSPSVIDLIIPPHKCICVQEGDLLAAVTFVKWRDSIRISYQKCSIQCNTAAAVCCTRSQKRKRSAFVFLKKKWQHTGIFFYRILYGGVAVVWQFPALCCQNQLLLLLNQASVATTALFFAVWICICVCGVWQKCSWQLWAAAAAVWTWIEFVQSDFFLFFFFTKWEFGGTRSHYQQHICGSI